MSSFTRPLRIECLDLPIKQKPFVILEPFYFVSDVLDGEIIEVPAGYRTDFASIPRLFWRVLPPFGRYGKAAVVHDWLCDVRPHICTSAVAAEVFLEGMTVLHVPVIVRMTMWAAVRCFGPRF